MSLREIIGKFTGPTAPRLATMDRGAARVEVPRLQVHTAEDTVIVTICPKTVEVVKEVAATKTAATLTNGELDLHLTPVDKKAITVKDPNKGWVLPLSKEDCAAIVEKLQPEENGYEVTEQLAFIVENIEC